jgi:hypothetical protein
MGQERDLRLLRGLAAWSREAAALEAILARPQGRTREDLRAAGLAVLATLPTTAVCRPYRDAVARLLAAHQVFVGEAPAA